MTKRRPANSRHDAFTEACQRLGYDVAAELIGLSENRLRNLGDPDRDGEPTIWQSETLDRALKGHGEEPVNLISYAARLGERPLTTQTHLQRALLELQQAIKTLDRSDRKDGQETLRQLAEIIRESARLQGFFLDEDRTQERGVRLVGSDRDPP